MTVPLITPAPAESVVVPEAGSLHPQTWVEIDLAALRRNFERFAERFDPNIGLIHSVKKDGYGHGLVEVARALEGAPRLVGFGVSTVAEGVRLRRAGIERPILIYAVTRGEALAAAVEHDLIPTVTDLAEAREVSEAATARGREVAVHLKVDTGMGRLGRTPAEALAAFPEIQALAGIRLEAVYTHLADGWGAPRSARAQVELLDAVLSGTAGDDVDSHIGGSDAMVLHREIRTGRIRSGIAVYGAHPGIADLEAVMTFKSRIIFRKRATRGSRISYGGTHTLARDSELALVGVGYGNGYPRLLSNRGEVLIRGRRCPVLGRVCMDQTVVDVSGVPEAAVGDEAVLFGRQGAERLPAAEVAQWAETIPYELMTVAGQINPRVYLERGDDG